MSELLLTVPNRADVSNKQTVQSAVSLHQNKQWWQPAACTSICSAICTEQAKKDICQQFQPQMWNALKKIFPRTTQYVPIVNTSWPRAWNNNPYVPQAMQEKHESYWSCRACSSLDCYRGIKADRLQTAFQLYAMQTIKFKNSIKRSTHHILLFITPRNAWTTSYKLFLDTHRKIGRHYWQPKNQMKKYILCFCVNILLCHQFISPSYNT